jgi:hypothetical protein
MVNITLKAKHFYFITYQLKNSTIEQYFSLISRIKTALTGNTDNEASFTVEASPAEVIVIFRTLTVLPEGVANVINVEMDDLLSAQIIAGASQEGANGIGPDAEGNLPENAYWQVIAQGVLDVKISNATARNNAIAQGKLLIDQI